MSTPGQTRTIGALADEIISRSTAELRPELQIVTDGYFGSERVRRRTIDAVFSGRSGSAPVAADAVAGALVVHTILVLLQAVATDTASDLIRGGVGDRWKRWRAKQLLQKAGSRETPESPVPALSPSEAVALGHVLRILLCRSGVAEDKVDAIVIAFEFALSPQARELHEETAE
jgi:hypothetical protein